MKSKIQMNEIRTFEKKISLMFIIAMEMWSVVVAVTIVVDLKVSKENGIGDKSHSHLIFIIHVTCAP